MPRPWLLPALFHWSSNMFIYPGGRGDLGSGRPAYSRPIAAPLKCAELLGVDLATIQDAVTHIRPYVQVDGTKVWSLMQLERHLRPQAYGRGRGAISPVAGSEPWTLNGSIARCSPRPFRRRCRCLGCDVSIASYALWGLVGSSN
jgi:hypothetical protein